MSDQLTAVMQALSQVQGNTANTLSNAMAARNDKRRLELQAKQQKADNIFRGIETGVNTVGMGMNLWGDYKARGLEQQRIDELAEHNDAMEDIQNRLATVEEDSLAFEQTRWDREFREDVRRWNAEYAAEQKWTAKEFVLERDRLKQEAQQHMDELEFREWSQRFDRETQLEAMKVAHRQAIEQYDNRLAQSAAYARIMKDMGFDNIQAGDVGGSMLQDYTDSGYQGDQSDRLAAYDRMEAAYISSLGLDDPRLFDQLTGGHDPQKQLEAAETIAAKVGEPLTQGEREALSTATNPEEIENLMWTVINRSAPAEESRRRVFNAFFGGQVVGDEAREREWTAWNEHALNLNAWTNTEDPTSDDQRLGMPQQWLEEMQSLGWDDEQQSLARAFWSMKSEDDNGELPTWNQWRTDVERAYSLIAREQAERERRGENYSITSTDAGQAEALVNSFAESGLDWSIPDDLWFSLTELQHGYEPGDRGVPPGISVTTDPQGRRVIANQTVPYKGEPGQGGRPAYLSWLTNNRGGSIEEYAAEYGLDPDEVRQELIR